MEVIHYFQDPSSSMRSTYTELDKPGEMGNKISVQFNANKCKIIMILAKTLSPWVGQRCPLR